jgi:hypothetical protein
MDKVGIGRKISACRKGLAQIRPVILIAGQHIYRRPRLRERGYCLSVFVLPSVVNDIPGMNDYIGCRLECVYVGNG